MTTGRITHGSKYLGFDISRGERSGTWRAKRGTTKLSSYSASGLRQMIADHERGLAFAAQTERRADDNVGAVHVADRRER